MVLTPDGRLASYFYGIRYPSGNLRLGLVEASQGRIGSPVDQLLLYCSQYDPATGKYSVIISHVLKLAALATILSLGAWYWQCRSVGSARRYESYLASQLSKLRRVQETMSSESSRNFPKLPVGQSTGNTYFTSEGGLRLFQRLDLWRNSLFCDQIPPAFPGRSASANQRQSRS